MTISAPQKEQHNIPQETIRGTIWGYLSFASGKLLNFVATLVLARLLLPEQFGLVAYCTVVIQYLDIINTAGINSALIARKDKLESAANAAFLINIFMGVAVFAFAWVLAPTVAEFFHEEQLVGMFRLTALVLPIDVLGLVPDALLQRNLRFREKLIPDISRNITKGLVSILLAYLGFGYWSLIWGQIAGTLISVILSWLLVSWRPNWVFEWETTREMLTYGGHIIMVGIAGSLRSNVDYIIVGRYLGATVLGIYTMAYRIPELAIKSFNEVVAKILFPLISREQSDMEKLRSYYLNYIRYISMFSFSIGTGIALTSNLFVSIFMSEKWAAAIQPLSMIAVALAVSSIGHAPGVLYKSINRPEILSRTTLVKLPFIIGLLIFCTRWGIMGIALGQIAFAVFSVALDSVIVRSVISLQWKDFASAILPSALASALMAFALSAVNILFVPAGIFGLLFLSVLGGLVFVGALMVFSRDSMIQLWKIINREVKDS